ncbi:MAG: ISNCY family transposase [Nitrospirota bacterium]
MAEKDMITMSRREAKRLHIIHRALEEQITQGEAARIIGLSCRQIRRIIKRTREEGDEGICHRSRGKASNRQIPRKVKEQALQLFKKEYHDFNIVHATEKLFEVHGIAINDETLRLWLNKAEIPYKKRKVKKHRQRRERRAHFGELVQIDGSHHDWFEGRGPICVFMGYIDDATNTVYGRFYDYEGTMPAMDSMKRYIKRYGIPQSVYLDKHSTYKSWAEPTIEEQLNDQKPMSQFEKSLATLATEVIHANSPQAKGRVERLFKTLQDRMVREMRLLGIKNVTEANEFLTIYLPRYNNKFSKAAASEVDLHRPALHSRDLDRILCIKEDRTVKNDFTIAYNNTLYQIEQATRAKIVTVEERLDGTLHITYNGQDLRFREIIKRPAKDAAKTPLLLQEKKPWVPPADHPWKKLFLSKRKKQEQPIAAP